MNGPIVGDERLWHHHLYMLSSRDIAFDRTAPSLHVRLLLISCTFVYGSLRLAVLLEVYVSE